MMFVVACYQFYHVRGQIDTLPHYLMRPLQFATDFPLLVASVVLLLFLFMCGAGQKRRIDAIVIERCRSVLTEYFNLNCDDHGKLILRARPAPR